MFLEAALRCARNYAAIACACFALLPGGLAAQDERSARLYGSHIEARASYRWPESCTRGYVPILLSFENGSKYAHDVHITATTQFGVHGLEVEGHVDLASGATRDVEWLLPLVPNMQRDMYLELRTNMESARMHGIGPSAPLPFKARTGVAFGPRTPMEAVPAWMIAWRQGQGAGAEVDNARPLDLVHLPYADLPTAWQAFTSLDVVILEAEVRLPDDHELEPIARYVTSGGTLVVLGAEGAQALPLRERFAAAFEPRFERGRAGRLAIHSLGLGLLILGDVESDALDPSELNLMGLALAAQHDFNPRIGDEPGRGATPAMEGLSELPIREYIIALLIFVLGIGPLNFWLVQRNGRPILFLVTVPTLALAFCCGLLAINFSREGFATKIASQSISCIDQRSERRATAEMRSFYAPFSLGPGLSPRASSALLAHHDPQQMRRTRHLLDLDRGLFAGDFLPSRRETSQVVIEEAASSERLHFERRGTELLVTNWLGTEVLELEVYDGEGQRLVLNQRLAAGAQATLVPAANSGAQQSLWLRFENFGYPEGTKLRIPASPRDLYVAALDTPRWLDRGPLFGEEAPNQEHLLLGILPLGELSTR